MEDALGGAQDRDKPRIKLFSEFSGILQKGVVVQGFPVLEWVPFHLIALNDFLNLQPSCCFFFFFFS